MSKTSIEGTKVLSITDGNNQKLDFISQEDKEVATFKLKYYMWLSRLFILFAVVSLSFFMSASLVIFKLSPEVSVEPFLIINQDSSEGIVRDEPITTAMASKNQLMESFVKQYIITRNSFINDEAEMRSRWYPGGIVNFLSAPVIFYEFFQSAQPQWKGLFDAKASTEVEIISIGKVGGEQSPVWKVDFNTYTMSETTRNPANKAPAIITRRWTSSVTSFFYPERSFVSLRLINPLGFTVVRYSQAEVEI